jgi:hypothetical protein
MMLLNRLHPSQSLSLLGLSRQLSAHEGGHVHSCSKMSEHVLVVRHDLHELALPFVREDGDIAVEVPEHAGYTGIISRDS